MRSRAGGGARGPPRQTTFPSAVISSRGILGIETVATEPGGTVNERLKAWLVRAQETVMGPRGEGTTPSAQSRPAPGPGATRNLANPGPTGRTPRASVERK